MPVITQPASVRNINANGNEYGPTPKDGNKQAISVGNYLQTNDITDTNNVLSPLAATATPATIICPKNAFRVTIIASAAARLSEIADMSQYLIIPANVPVVLDIARQGNLYVRAETTANVSFAFTTL